MTDKLLVLDIDETLLHSEPLEPDFEVDFVLVDEYYSLKRPYVDQFLKYAFDNFTVGVFTTAAQDYAEDALKKLGVDLSKLLFLWSRERCTYKYDIYEDKHYYVKKLDKVKKQFKCDLNKVLIVDDNRTTAMYNYGNLLEVSPFYGDRKDGELLKLIDYLNKVKGETNLRSLEKRGWLKS